MSDEGYTPVVEWKPRAIALIPAVRPDGTLVWIPRRMAKRIGMKKRGERLTEAMWNDEELQALIHSRTKANEAGVVCDSYWHEQNGYV